MIHDLPEDEREDETVRDAAEQTLEPTPESESLEEDALSTTEFASDIASIDSVGDEELPDRPAPPPTDAAVPAAQPVHHTTQFASPVEVHVPPASQASADRHGYELPIGAGESADGDPVDQIFPPALRVPVQDARAAAEAETNPPQPAAREDIGRPLPRIQVLVTLADARAQLEEVLQTAMERFAPNFQELAVREVKHAAWVRKCEERAADYRLRGPG